MITENRKWYFGYGDPYGDDSVDHVFYDNILPLLKKYKLEDKDIESIVKNIDDMCSTAYQNGYGNCIFDENEG